MHVRRYFTEGVMFAHIKAASWPLIASISAIAISPLLVLATAQGTFYNLWLAVMMIALWAGQRLTKREVGIAVGDPQSYFIALAYAVGIIGCVALGAWATQLIDLKDYSATTVFRRLSLNFLVTFVLALITEEGFFRGALWEAAHGPDLLRQKLSSGQVLLSACGISPCRSSIRNSLNHSARCRNT